MQAQVTDKASSPKGIARNTYSSSCSSVSDESSYTSSEDDGLSCGGADFGLTARKEAMSVDQISRMLRSAKFDVIAGNTLCQRSPQVSSNVSLRDCEEGQGEISGDHKESVGPSLTKTLSKILEVNGYQYCGGISIDQAPNGFFEEIMEENIKAYTVEVISAVRLGNIDELERLLDLGHCMQCCNKFGESILHLACRRGYTEVVRFLIEKAKVSINIKDDYGRTPLHDACWVNSPNFELIEMLIRSSPDLLLMQDIRGHTPLQYVKKDTTRQWDQFLTEKAHLIKPSAFCRLLKST